MDSFISMLGVDVLVQLVLLPISVGILFVCARLFKLRDSSFMTPLKVVAVAVLFALGVDAVALLLLSSVSLLLAGLASLFMLVVFYVLLLFLIKFFYREGWRNTLLVWLVFSVVDFVVTVVVMFVVAIVVGLLFGLSGYGGLMP